MTRASALIAEDAPESPTGQMQGQEAASLLTSTLQNRADNSITDDSIKHSRPPYTNGATVFTTGQISTRFAQGSPADRDRLTQQSIFLRTALNQRSPAESTSRFIEPRRDVSNISKCRPAAPDPCATQLLRIAPGHIRVPQNPIDFKVNVCR